MAYFDEKKSVLPKWLLRKGLTCECDILSTRKDIEYEIKHFKNSPKIAKNRQEKLKHFQIYYFDANDVEKAFREMIKREKNKNGHT